MAGKPARVKLSLGSDSDSHNVSNVGNDSASPSLSRHIDDAVVVTATLYDAAGTRIPDSSLLVKFRAQGPGKLSPSTMAT